ncbi:GNAT family N-acetyltransferase [Streptococcus loxodontisalivarius]|uniref:Ribosomal-protein-alanine N-acetyltransferase n=1 Tax=Streptococcus loxodontisalivarius TaxID=1349415 RepID=A0ABS2PTD7_9STRE|nr:GNAT family N-acetyltransferase [Streptococcus loxodontisalivarius]MBM7643303.1 ribosomal-protein-alanine N-acetyltransferase [Streptococcus loxodontisalivarius]
MLLENKKLEELILRFPEDVQEIFSQMIISYQLGYVDYVYQTDDVSIQNRRIKNLVKSFRRMDYFYVMPLSQDLALDVINQWAYPKEFSSFEINHKHPNYSQFISEEARGDSYLAIIRNGAHIGYAYFVAQPDGDIDLTFALKPNRMGKGLGVAFYQSIEDYLKTNHQAKRLLLELSLDNSRALRLMEKLGYERLGETESGLRLAKMMEEDK